MRARREETPVPSESGYEMGLVAHFEAAHRLRGDFGPATRLHGHTYRVEFTVTGRDLRADGTLGDLGVLRSASEEAMAGLHYQNLDELPVFQGCNSTAEAVARHLFTEIAPRLRKQGYVALTVRVWESDAVWAGYTGAVDEATGLPTG